MPSQPRTPALVALAAVVVPLPLHLAGHKVRPHGDRWAGVALHARKHPTAAARHQHHGHIRVAVPAPRPRAHAAGDPTDTISDFMFSPGTITIHVGDTVTWINNGPSPHTATASDGSFNTGTLQKGGSASHTFTQAGTFAYICSIHPFMHGTIVVIASSSSASSAGSASGSGSTSSGSGSGASSGPGGTSASSTGGGSTLPMTGLDVAGTVLAGIALVSLGVGLRRAGRARQTA